MNTLYNGDDLANHQVRLQALSQETVYWRQFALESDRNNYRSYMASDPFQNEPPSLAASTCQSGIPNTARFRDPPPETELKTPVDGIGRPVEVTTPTRGSRASHSLMPSRHTESVDVSTGVIG